MPNKGAMSKTYLSEVAMLTLGELQQVLKAEHGLDISQQRLRRAVDALPGGELPRMAHYRLIPRTLIPLIVERFQVKRERVLA